MSNNISALKVIIGCSFIIICSFLSAQFYGTLNASPTQSTIPPVSSCAPDPWQLSTPLPAPRNGHAAVVVNNFIYVLGGSPSRTSVIRAPINNDDTLGEWTPSAEMISPRSELAAVTANNNIYALGGSAERAVVQPDGSLGPWQPETPMLYGGTRAVVVNNRIYAVSGQNVESAPINVDGSLGSWQRMNSLRVSHGFYFALVATNNYIYVLGGGDGDSSFATVERAFINADGSLDRWQLLPEMNTDRSMLTAVEAEGHIYTLGGFRTGINQLIILDSVERAEIQGDGTLGPWQYVHPMKSRRIASTAVVAQNHIYVIGVGVDQFGNVANNGEHAAIWALPPLDYSITINQGQLFTNQTEITLTLRAKPRTVQMQVSNDGGFADAQWEPCLATKSWAITAYGTRIVYVRFKDQEGNVSPAFQDDIILDVMPPTGSVSIVEEAEVSTAASLVTLVLTASDDISGVSEMAISHSSDFVGVDWQAFQSVYNWSLGNNDTVFVKFRDNAGNVSAVYSASLNMPQFYIRLPLVWK